MLCIIKENKSKFEYSFGDKEEDDVISEQTNHKKREVLYMIKSKLKIIKYTKQHSQKNISIKSLNNFYNYL